eukprot:gnl/TRDRNA2_/TRDRNA2_37638_c0_seq1.p1 gnl/TRDRNA2_/TRDRNA2_37638_c0~~gnl/TRDRNA2_/TRDRNA2_37638_c0_seq1.p1  ORF type:complete len:275 (-),score=54.15 gnl/TRDRNA2_/TRDRNA2_37638_c0_seq1:141-965(-)
MGCSQATAGAHQPSLESDEALARKLQQREIDSSLKAVNEKNMLTVQLSAHPWQEKVAHLCERTYLLQEFTEGYVRKHLTVPKGLQDAAAARLRRRKRASSPTASWNTRAEAADAKMGSFRPKTDDAAPGAPYEGPRLLPSERTVALEKLREEARSAKAKNAEVPIYPGDLPPWQHYQHKAHTGARERDHEGKTGSPKKSMQSPPSSPAGKTGSPKKSMQSPPSSPAGGAKKIRLRPAGPGLGMDGVDENAPLRRNELWTTSVALAKVEVSIREG